MRAIAGYQGSLVTKCALQLGALLFVRPGELRRAEWSEIDFDACEWRIPAERMKMRSRHIVPLSRQAVAILRELQPLTGNRQYVFPGGHSPRRCMSENAMLGALRRLRYAKGEMTPHGFRSMASTLLNEQGWNRDAIERQLAHAERDSVRAAYNYAEHLAERRKMMQAWVDYLDRLAADSVVVPISSARTCRRLLSCLPVLHVAELELCAEVRLPKSRAPCFRIARTSHRNARVRAAFLWHEVSVDLIAKHRTGGEIVSMS